MELDDRQEQPAQNPAAALTRCRRTPLLRVQMVQLVREGSAPFVLKQVNTAYDAYAAFKDLCQCADREHVWTVLLNQKNRVIGIEEISRGCLASAPLHPREVFKGAVLANAAKILLIHVHPSGDPSPSAEDVAITRRLREAGTLLGVEVLDSIVIGHGRFVSFLDDGYW
jgi:DNA repair protein RadC